MLQRLTGGDIRWESAFFSFIHLGFGHGSLRFFGGVTVNSHSEDFDVIELLTKLKKFCPVENRHEMGRGNQDGSGAGSRSILATRGIIL